MTVDVTIDRLEEADIDAAVFIDLVSFEPSELGAGSEDPRRVRERSLREELARPWSRLRAARDPEGRVLGYLLFWHVVDEVHLLNVAVAMEARMRGIGRALLEDLIGYGRANDVARILLEVRSTNAVAIGLYESLGFVSFNVRPRYYADGVDAVEMALSLAAV
jgi:ribosomal-protein-alanine N-acetyltransferase